MFFKDLDACTYFGRWSESLSAIGWLQIGHDFRKGPVSEEFFAALVRLLINPWQPVAMGGRGSCGFCRFSMGPAHLSYGGSTVALGTTNLFVPGAEGIFVAPSLIAHYIDAHEYCPPDVFQEAVVGCPEMRSLAYLKKIKAGGLRTFT